MTTLYETWERQRAECDGCRHMVRADDPDQDVTGTIMRCRLWLEPGGWPHVFCIDARDPASGMCGPGGDWYKP